MKRFKKKSNAYGEVIEYYRNKKGYSRADLSREMDLIDIPMSQDELYRVEKQRMILKDYELIAICLLLEIDYKDLENIIKEKK